MATQYELRHPESTRSASPVLAKARPGNPSHRPNPFAPPIRPTAKRPRPQIGDSARLWHFMESQWMEGEIEAIHTGYPCSSVALTVWRKLLGGTSSPTKGCG